MGHLYVSLMCNPSGISLKKEIIPLFEIIVSVSFGMDLLSETRLTYRQVFFPFGDLSGSRDKIPTDKSTNERIFLKSEAI